MINNPVNGGFQPTQPVRESAPAVVAVPVAPTAAPAAEAATAAAASKQAQPQAVMPKLEAAVSKLNDYVQSIRRTLSFSIEESTGRTVIKVYDAETDELIRQIPPEETIKLAEVLENTATTPSLLLKERA